LPISSVHARTPRCAAGLLVAGLLASGCGSTAQAARSHPAHSAVDTAARPAHTAAHTAAGTTVSAAQSQAAPTDAVQLRSTLERLLGAHVLLADQFVRTAVTGQAQQNAAAGQSVARNQAELVALVTAQGGAAAGQQFAAAWQNHVDVLAAYATALQRKDTAAQAAARQQYVAAEQQLARSFSTVVGGTVPLPALSQAATMHGEHLLDQADAFATGGYDTAYSVQRAAFGHMVMAADVLARGAADAKGLPTAELDAPRRTLQTAMSSLLAQHMGLMVQAMRAAHDRSPDFPAAGRAVNLNSTELAGAIRTLYGEPASQQFLGIWARHVEALIAYASAGDEAEREQRRDAGTDYAPELARFLATATEQRLPAIELAASLTEHDDHLRDSLDAYAQEDHDTSQTLAERGYAHMFELSQGLASAVGDVVAAKLPQGGPATGGGGLAGRH
jgi:hypothetical protein